MRRLTALLLTGVLALAVVACSDDDGGGGDGDASGATTTSSASGDGTTTTTADDDLVPIVFNGEGNNLNVYSSVAPYETQRLFTNAAEDPEGTDINAQMCFWDDPDLGRLFIAGEDTGQPDPPQGWGIFRLDGQRVGELAATQIGKLTPTYQGSGDNAENYGCGLLSDGRMLTTDVGNQALGPGDGQLIIWFPPFDSYEVAYCKLDIGIGTAQSILVDENDDVYVASTRAGGADRPAGVYRYSGPFPTGPTPDDGCDTTDGTGAPMASQVNREVFIPASGENGVAFPAGLAFTPDGGFYVSSVASGVIGEFDASGAFVRTILAPPEGEQLDEDSYSTGTPLGIGVTPDGAIWVADIGVVRTEADDGTVNIGPGDGNGRLLRIAFDDAGDPLPPETIDEGLAFPDGIGVFAP